ncbi:MAG: hypothetical protein IPF62_14850 [Bacteroidetes bacterium]|nr:hypothetical protein [Bacteroidota bacterium]
MPSVDDLVMGNVLGLTTTTVNVEATASFHNGQPFCKTWYQITPNSNGSADVVLCISIKSDFDDYNNVLLPPYQPLPHRVAIWIRIFQISVSQNDDAGLGNNPL